MVKTHRACAAAGTILLVVASASAQTEPADAPGASAAAPTEEPAKDAGAGAGSGGPQAATDNTSPSGAAEPGPAAAQPSPYALKLREIEERVNALKEKIFQSKARLIQLQEVVLHGAISGAKAVIVHRNDMGGSFKLSRVQCALDGTPIFNRVDNDTGELAEQERIEIFNGSVAPGDHQIALYLEYRGGGFGFFSYLDEFKFGVKSRYTFHADEGKVTTVTVIGHEKGGLTTRLQDKPTVRYEVETQRALRETSTDGPPSTD
jgi:hypothetical protein